ncbi:MAG: 2-hydroxyacyl-CoA dehydratase subunit D [Thermodesulfobacteriota bacterium]
MDFGAWQAFLGDMLREPENGFLVSASAEGRIPVGYTCSYVPQVILSVDGLVPVRLRAPGAAGTEIADIYLSNVVCSYTRSLLEFAMDGRYDFLGGWVFASGCDHIRRLLDNLVYLRTPRFTHMVDVPHRRGAMALAWYEEELCVLCARLSAAFGVDTGRAALSRAISRYNDFNRKVQIIGDCRKEKNPPVSGTEFQRIMIASLSGGRDQMMAALDRMAGEIPGRPGNNRYRARLMVVGGNVDDTAFIELLESSGGIVVADRFCTGSIPETELIDEGGDPLKAIAKYTLDRQACPRMMEDFTERMAAILRTRDEYQADGVVIENLKFCDIWGIESALLVQALRDAGVPVLRVERDYRQGSEGQLRTRVQAFIESMGK